MAYLKTNYPEETYSVLLEYYLLGKKRNIGKVSECKKELESIGYTIKQIQYGQDNTQFSLENNAFTQSMLAMKSSNIVLAQTLASLSSQNITNYFEIYEKIKEPKNEETNRAYVTKRNWKILCQVDYFPNENNRKLELFIPLLYDKVYSKKQFRADSLAKLKQELNIEFDIKPYCSKITAKTFYLSDNPKTKMQLCMAIYNQLECQPYTVEQKVRNQIDVYGFVSDPSQYTKHSIFTGTIQAISKKSNSILMKTLTDKETWIEISGDISQLRRRETIVIFKAQQKIRHGKLGVMATDYITYK